LAPIDKAVLGNKILSQPKVEGQVTKNLSVDNIVNTEEKTKGYAFRGKAEPGSVVTLYIYSDMPLLVTTQVDEFGNWEYELSESLIDGEHEVYAVVNDNTGNIVNKSNPLNFFVKEARAMSVKDFVATTGAQPISSSESFTTYFLIIALLVIVIGIVFFIIFYKINKNKQKL